MTSSPRSHGPFTLLPCLFLISGDSPRPSSWGARDGVRERKGEEITGRGAGDQKKKGRGTSKKMGCNTRTSQEVTQPSTTLAQARLTAEF